MLIRGDCLEELRKIPDNSIDQPGIKTTVL